MKELLDRDGVWTQDLINLMVRVAEEIEAGRDERQFMTIAALFSKDGGKKFTAFVDRIRRRVEDAQLAARGEERIGSGAEDFKKAFGGEGL